MNNIPSNSSTQPKIIGELNKADNLLNSLELAVAKLRESYSNVMSTTSLERPEDDTETKDRREKENITSSNVAVTINALNNRLNKLHSSINDIIARSEV